MKTPGRLFLLYGPKLYIEYVLFETATKGFTGKHSKTGGVFLAINLAMFWNSVGPKGQIFFLMKNSVGALVQPLLGAHIAVEDVKIERNGDIHWLLQASR